MMAKRKAKRRARKSAKRRVRIDAKGVARAIDRETKAAQRIVARGTQAVAAARKQGNRAALAANQEMLQRAKRVLAALKKASTIAHPRRPKGVTANGDGCPFGVLGPDPFIWE